MDRHHEMMKRSYLDGTVDVCFQEEVWSPPTNHLRQSGTENDVKLSLRMYLVARSTSGCYYTTDTSSSRPRIGAMLMLKSTCNV